MFVELNVSEGTGTGDTFWGNCNEYRFITLLVVKKYIYTYILYNFEDQRQLLRSLSKGLNEKIVDRSILLAVSSNFRSCGS